MPVAPRMPTSILFSINLIPQQPADHILIDADGVFELPLGDAFFERVRDVNGTRADQERGPPGTAERWDVRGIGDHGGVHSGQRAEPQRRDFEYFAGLRPSVHGPRDAVPYGGR